MKHIRTMSRQAAVPGKAQTSAFEIKITFLVDSIFLIVTKFVRGAGDDGGDGAMPM